ncbi:MAG: thiamine diphosphokinase [Syntrophomonadaceae bacterium]
MKCVILANGEYGDDLETYRDIVDKADCILCADGGANYAYQLKLVPDCIIGDMDSIAGEVREYFSGLEVSIKKYPRQKDFTDTQLALSEAEARGADEIILIGSLGKRLDHTLGNLYSCMDLAVNGIKVSHLTLEMQVHLITTELRLTGRPGDLVSVLVLSDRATGVSEKGFEYPLQNAVLVKGNPYAVSNVMVGTDATITVKEGVLAVFHYYRR